MDLEIFVDFAKYMNWLVALQGLENGLKSKAEEYRNLKSTASRWIGTDDDNYNRVCNTIDSYARIIDRAREAVNAAITAIINYMHTMMTAQTSAASAIDEAKSVADNLF